MAEDLQLAERLKQADAELTIAPEVRSLQVLAIQAELADPSTGGLMDRRQARQARRRLAVAAAVLVAVLPFGAAIASSGAVPGDSLYGTKRTVERVVSLVDSDVAFGNRVDELRLLIDREADPEVIITAQDDVARWADEVAFDHPLRDAYRMLALGARHSNGILDNEYRQQTVVRWEAGERYAASLPDGEIVTIDGSGSRRLLSASGEWIVERVSDDRWIVSEGIIGSAPGLAAFEIVVVGDDVEARLLHSTARADSESDDVEPLTLDEPEPESEVGVDSVFGGTDDGSAPEASDEDGPQDSPTTSTTSNPVNSTDPPDTKPTPTTIAKPSTTASSKPSTSATTRPPTTTTTSRPPTTRPTTTRPPTTTTTTQPTTTTTVPTTTTTRCDGDDDDDDECDDD